MVQEIDAECPFDLYRKELEVMKQRGSSLAVKQGLTTFWADPVRRFYTGHKYPYKVILLLFAPL